MARLAVNVVMYYSVLAIFAGVVLLMVYNLASTALRAPQRLPLLVVLLAVSAYPMYRAWPQQNELNDGSDLGLVMDCARVPLVFACLVGYFVLTIVLLARAGNDQARSQKASAILIAAFFGLVVLPASYVMYQQLNDATTSWLPAEVLVNENNGRFGHVQVRMADGQIIDLRREGGGAPPFKAGGKVQVEMSRHYFTMPTHISGLNSEGVKAIWPDKF